MSTKTSAAARRSVLSAVLIRMLQVLGWDKERSGPSLASMPKASRRSTVFETLEPRLLLSADLTGDLSGVVIPDHVLPSDHLTIPVVVHNAGTDVSSLTPVVRLYASASGQVDPDSVVLGESAIKNAAIKAGKSTTVNVAIDPSMIDAPGSYSLIAVVDATNRVNESNEANNTAVATRPLHIDWSFGSVPGHANADSITLTDPAGTQVTFKLSGPGHGDVQLDGNAFDVHLTGTTASSKLSITAAGRSGVATVNDLQVEGSLGAVQASDVNLTGNFDLSGTVRSLELGNIGPDAGIAIAGTGTPIKFSAGRVTGADIFSASPFDSISIAEWRSAGADAGAILAPSIGDLEVDGNFSGDLKLSGATSGSTLGSAEIGGRISSSMWNVVGSTGSIEAGSTGADWHGNFDSLQKFTTDGDFRGVLAAPVIGMIHVGGDVASARVLVGADLGSDGMPGGSGDAADHFFQGVLTQLRVDHSIRDSTILVGVNPVDGIYGNGNDVIVGGQASRIHSLVVDGRLLGSTDITAGAFAHNVKINGANVNPASAPQLHTSLSDIVAPQLSAALAIDTGASASDYVTGNPAVAGTAYDAGGLATLTAALDGSALMDIKGLLNPDATFSLDASALASIYGAPVADGAHTLVLRAADASNNVSTSSLSFTLDSSAPAIAAFGLDASSESGIPGDQLTNHTVVTLGGIAEAGATVELLGTGMTTIADNAGAFSFANISLAEGDNVFNVRAADIAGNASSFVYRAALDTTLPFFSAGLRNDSGLSSVDNWTNDPSLIGFLSEPESTVSLTLEFFDNTRSETISVPTSGGNFVVSADAMDALGGGRLADGPYFAHLQARDGAGNVAFGDVNFVLDRSAPTPPGFDLAPESDTGVQGDQHTTQSIVSLTGLADTGGLLTLDGSSIEPTWQGNVFRFDGVALHTGENVLTVRSVDLSGDVSVFKRSIFLDGGGTGSGGPLPDLVVTQIDSQVTGQDEFGQTMLHVEWTTANTGSAVAHGQGGSWYESLYVSMYDAKDFSGDDLYLGTWAVIGDLAAGAQQVDALDVVLPSFVPAGYHLYVVVDDGNQVFEKTAGEYNNTTIDYVPSGMPPPDIAPSGPGLFLDGTPVGGSIDAPGETDVYTFDLAHESKIYFDSLSSHSDVKWELQTADGQTLFGRTFDTSDAFGMGDINALLDLQAGSYKIVVSGELANSTDSYAFRLMDVDAVASHSLVLDGGPLLGQHMARGDQTDVYQFDATAGTQYVVGGLGDRAIEQDMVFRLFDPEGHQIWKGDSSPSDISTFAETGTYTLLVEGNVQHTDGFDYNVYVFTPQDRHFDLAYTGSQISGFLDAPGQVNTYSFTLVGSSTFAVDGVFGSNGTSFDWSIDGPNGAHFSGNTSFDSALMDLGEGNYTISIKGEGDASGWYNFRLMDVLRDSAQVLTADVPVNNISYPGFNSTLFRFEALAGEHFVVSLTTTDTPDMSFDSPQWLLLDPQGHLFQTGVAGTPTEFDPTQSGGWTLLLSGRQYSWTPVDYTLAINAQVAV